MYSAQCSHYIAMKKRRILRHMASLYSEDNVPSMNNQRMSLVRTWTELITGNYLSNFWPENNPLSVTIVNDEILNPSIRNEDVSSILHEKKMLFFENMKQRYSNDCNESMLPVSILEPTNHPEWLVIDDPNLINIKNDMNLTKNSGDTCGDHCIIESHSLPRVNKTEKIMEDKIIDISDSSVVEPPKYEVDTHEDADVESFHVVSHSDVSTAPLRFVLENPMFRLTNICRNVWNSLASQFYCPTESVKRPVYLCTKQHQRRKANLIAMGRGRGRAKCQLRRSGVSQTVRRKECIKQDDCEAWPDSFVATANCSPVDNKLDNLDNMDIPYPAPITKQIDSPAISNCPAGTLEGKPKACKKEIKVRYMTKGCYTANSSKMNDYNYCEDGNNEMPHVREDSRLRTLSESSVEDDWIVFEDDDEKREATEYSAESRCALNLLTRKNDSPCKNSNGKIYNVDTASFRLRLSSESSSNSEDSFVPTGDQETVEYLRMRYDCSTKISDEHRKREDFNSQKKLFRHRRLSSDSSENSNDSNSLKNDDNCNGSFTTEGSDDVDGYDEVSFYDGDSQPENDSIVFADEDSEELVQTKKVNFDLDPVVHVMVTWDYAYRAARKGPWEEMARDNERFRGRINSIAIVLNPILKSKHRLKIWQERFASSE